MVRRAIKKYNKRFDKFCENLKKQALLIDNEFYQQNQYYLQGAEDAWRVAGRIAATTKSAFCAKELYDLFGDCTFNHIFSLPVKDVIMRIAEYDRKVGNIEVGDVVAIQWPDNLHLITQVRENSISGVRIKDGMANTITRSKAKLIKTGRHYDLDKLFRSAMHTELDMEEIYEQAKK